MYDPISNTSMALAQWRTITELPKAVQQAADVFDAISSLQAPSPLWPTGEATPENVGELVNTLSAELQSVDSWKIAVTQAKRVQAFEVMKALAAAAPDVITKLNKAVTLAAKQFVESLEQLPADRSAESLLMTPGGSDLWAKVLDSQQMLIAAREFALSLVSLPAFAAYRYEPVLAIINCTDRATYDQVTNAPNDGSGVDPQLVCAARLGLSFIVRDPAAAAELATRLNDEPAVSKFKGFTRLEPTANGGERLVTAQGEAL